MRNTFEPQPGEPCTRGKVIVDGKIVDMITHYGPIYTYVMEPDGTRREHIARHDMRDPSKSKFQLNRVKDFQLIESRQITADEYKSLCVRSALS
jgi:hypothetical protein